MLIAGLVPVGFLAFSMQYGMMNQLREKEQYNLEKMLEQSVSSIENQSQIYKNLVDYLSYSQNLRNIFDVETESDYEKYLKYVKVADHCCRCRRSITKRSRALHYILTI